MWYPWSSEPSVQCKWNTLKEVGARCGPFLIQSKLFLQYPSHASGPLPQLASKFCLDERVGIVAGVALGATACAGILTLLALSNCIQCKPIKSGKQLVKAALWVTVPAALLYVSDNFNKWVNI